MVMKNWIKWWKCWGKKKAKSGKASYSQSSSLLSTQDTSESDGTQMAAKKNSNNNNNNNNNLLHESMNSMYSDAPSMGSTPSSKRLTLRKLSIIKKDLDQEYTGQFNFKTGYEHDFKTIKMLGRGAFGSVFLASKRQSKGGENLELFAVKRIKKELLKSKRHGHALLMEIEIMMKMRNNLNVVHIEDVYEDSHAVYMVMEYCSGGDLIQNSKSSPMFSEADVRLYFQDIIRLIGQCHKLKILHRDIKPDNFLKADKNSKSPLKMIDFGLSCMWKGKPKKDMTGTPFYMAPEVFAKTGYGYQADMWSAGCVLYFLVAGQNPFEPCDTFPNLQKKVCNRDASFSSPVWNQVSEQLKDLTKKLLDRDPETRLTYKLAAKHPWLDTDISPSAALNDTMIQKFQSTGSFHRLKRKVLTEALKYLELEEAEELAILFSQIDVNQDGFITKEELIHGLKNNGYKVSDHDSKVIIENIDVDGNGELDQNEFVVALLDLRTLQKQRKWQNIIKDLFDEMDKDKDGQLCAEEIKAAIPYSELLEEIDDEVQQIMEEVDIDGSGTIDITEFKKMINETAETLDTFDKRLRKRYASAKY